MRAFANVKNVTGIMDQSMYVSVNQGTEPDNIQRAYQFSSPIPSRNLLLNLFLNCFGGKIKLQERTTPNTNKV